MAILAAKLLLAPGLVAAATLTARRFGPRAGGWLGALPVVFGPILVVYVLEQDAAFAAEAATASLLGLVALSAFIVGYGFAAVRARWAVAIAVALAVFGASVAALEPVDVGALPGLVAALASFAAAAWALSRIPTDPLPLRPAPAWDLPVRVAATAALVLVLTGLASSLGPRLSGLLASFPVLTTVLACFTHARDGGGAAVRLLRGLLAGLPSFATFAFVCAITLDELPTLAAFGVASAAALIAHGIGALLGGTQAEEGTGAEELRLPQTRR